MYKNIAYVIFSFIFFLTSIPSYSAQNFNINQLPTPGNMVHVSKSFVPLALKGMIVDIHKPLDIQFIVDSGNAIADRAFVNDNADVLIKYFLAGLTIPEKDLWVNLSPYEKDRIVPQALGQTELGRDLLAQDYLLKQLTASLIYPEKDLGKSFWGKVYAKTKEHFGSTAMPVNTFNKVWILPHQAQVYENKNAVYVTQATLKVMVDDDYMATEKNFKHKNSITQQVVKDVILPEIEKEVNYGANFAPLRQIYQSLILAKWYKETIANGILDTLYKNHNKIEGINLHDVSIKQKIYDRYLQAYKKGVFNFIKEDGHILKKYFSGGITNLAKVKIDLATAADVKVEGSTFLLDVSLRDSGMLHQSKDTASKNNDYVAFTYAGLPVHLGSRDLYEAIKNLLRDQKNKNVINDFLTEGNLGAFYIKNEELMGVYQVQVNPARHPDNRAKLKPGKNAAPDQFLRLHNMPDEEAGIPFANHYYIVPNPNPYEKNHIVLPRQPLSDGYYHGQLIQSTGDVDVAFNLLDTLKQYQDVKNYNVTFNSFGAANSSPDFHYQGFESHLPIFDHDIDEVGADGNLRVGFVKDFKAHVMYLESADKELLKKSVYEGVLHYFNQGYSEENRKLYIPYNVLFRQEGQLYKVYIYPRVKDAPANMPNNKFGIIEMSGTLITYNGDATQGKVNVGTHDNAHWQTVTKDMFDAALEDVTYKDKDYLKSLLLGVIDTNQAMSVNQADLGGVNLDQITIESTGKKVIVHYDIKDMEHVNQSTFKGFTPVIKDIKPVIDILFFLGV